MLVLYVKQNTPKICTEYKQYLPQLILFNVLYGRIAKFIISISAETLRYGEDDMSYLIYSLIYLGCVC